jgi:hypothetical protein
MMHEFLERVCQQEVSSQNRSVDTGDFVKGWPPPPEFGLVDDIIVGKGGGMREFGRTGADPQRLAGRAEQLPDKQTNQGTGPLAPGQQMHLEQPEYALRFSISPEAEVELQSLVNDIGESGTHWLEPFSGRRS